MYQNRHETEVTRNVCISPKDNAFPTASRSRRLLRKRLPNQKGQCLAPLSAKAIRKGLPNHQRWWSLSGSNRRPPACKAGALPAELKPQVKRSADVVLASDCKANAEKHNRELQALNSDPRSSQAPGLNHQGSRHFAFAKLSASSHSRCLLAQPSAVTTTSLAFASLSWLSTFCFRKIVCRPAHLVFDKLSLVGPGRFELPTSPLSGVRSNQLSYGPRSSKASAAC
jgi:hypothetical protein